MEHKGCGKQSSTAMFPALSVMDPEEHRRFRKVKSGQQIIVKLSSCYGYLCVQMSGKQLLTLTEAARSLSALSHSMQKRNLCSLLWQSLQTSLCIPNTVTMQITSLNQRMSVS